MEGSSGKGRPGLREFEYNGSREPMSNIDKNIIIVTSSLLGVLMVALCMLFTLEWALKRLHSSQPNMKPAPPGLKKLQLAALPSSLFPSAPSSPAPLHSTCPICLAPFASADPIRLLPRCHHAFHVACIDPWLSRQSSCPTCRNNVVLDTPIAPSLLDILITPTSTSAAATS